MTTRRRPWHLLDQTLLDYPKYSESRRCTEATLRAFGITGIPLTGSGCLSYLTAAGYTLTEVTNITGVRLDRFRFDPTKRYLVNTRGHAMAVINGLLIDTMRRSFDSRRIEFLWIVSGNPFEEKF